MHTESCLGSGSQDYAGILVLETRHLSIVALPFVALLFVALLFVIRHLGGFLKDLY